MMVEGRPGLKVYVDDGSCQRVGNPGFEAAAVEDMALKV